MISSTELFVKRRFGHCIIDGFFFGNRFLDLESLAFVCFFVYVKLDWVCCRILI